MAIVDDADLVQSLNDIVFPVVLNALKPGYSDQIDEALAIAVQIIYVTKKVPDKYFSLLPHLLVQLMGQKNDDEGGALYEQFIHTISFFANIIKYDTQRFCSVQI